MVNATITETPVQDLKRTRSSSFVQSKPKVLRPFNTNEVKILLLENINETAVNAFKKQGYQVETVPKALAGDELLDKIRDVNVIGIRSKTKLTKQVLEQAKNLLAIGCFCIGTNQVDLQAAANQGVSVFQLKSNKKELSRIY